MGAKKQNSTLEEFIGSDIQTLEDTSHRIITIPNLMSLSRIGLAVSFPFVEPQFQWAIIVFALLTEFLDGHIARAFNCVTELGKLLDPIADKIFLLSLGLTWILTGAMSGFELLLLSSREICFFLGGLYFVAIGTTANIKPTDVNRWGKLTTAMQYAFFFLFLMDGIILNILLIMIAISGAVSAAQYFAVMHRRSFL